jgi:hypothetical protein
MKHYVIFKEEERVFHGYEKEAIEYLSSKAKDFNKDNWQSTNEFQVIEYPYYLPEEETEEFIEVETTNSKRPRRIIIEGMYRHEPEILKALRRKKTWGLEELRELEGW